MRHCETNLVGWLENGSRRDLCKPKYGATLTWNGLLIMKCIRTNLVPGTLKARPLVLYKPNANVWHLVLDTPHKHLEVDFILGDQLGFDIQIGIEGQPWMVNLEVRAESTVEAEMFRTCSIHQTRTKYGAIFTLASPSIYRLENCDPVIINQVLEKGKRISRNHLFKEPK
jgi:hypothetical protein